MQKDRRLQCDALLREFDDVTAAFQKMLDDLGGAAATQRPSRTAWSVAECVEHLSATSETYLSAWRNATAATGSLDLHCSRPFRLGLATRLMVWSLEPPALIRISSPPQFAPHPEGRTAAEAYRRFVENQREIC